MRGPRQIRHLVCDWLQADLPVRLPQIRLAWGRTEEELPLPMRYDPHEPLTLDHAVSPIVAVVSGRQTVRPVGDMNALGEPLFNVTYPMRIFAWVREVGVGATFDLRDDYLTALQVAVLASPTLGGVGGGNLLALSTSVEVDFSGIDALKGDRQLAGGYVGFQIRATETLSNRLAHPESPEGRTVSAVTVQGAVLPTHPRSTT